MAISELLRLGYRVPEDMTVVGFGDYSAATQISPHLTTVKIHGIDIGASLVRLLDDRAHGRIAPDVAVRMLMTAKIVERASSGPARVAPPVLRSIAAQ